MRRIVGIVITLALLGAGCQQAPDVPQQPAARREIIVTVGPTGVIDWDGEALSFEEFDKRIAEAAGQVPKPLIITQTPADCGLDCFEQKGLEAIGRVMTSVAVHDMGKIGIVAGPPK